MNHPALASLGDDLRLFRLTVCGRRLVVDARHCPTLGSACRAVAAALNATPLPVLAVAHGETLSIHTPTHLQ